MPDLDEERVVAALPTAVQRRIGRELLQMLRNRSSDEVVLPPERELSKQLEVSRPTLRRVLQELEQAGVIRNLSTRGRILTGTGEGEPPTASLLSQTVAILAPDDGMNRIDRQRARMPGWAYHTTQAVYDELHRHGWHALGFSPNQLNDVQVQRLIRDRPAGVVITMLQSLLVNEELRRLIDPLLAADIPIVSQNLPSDSVSLDSVDSDQAAGAAKLVRFLAERGRRRILRVWGRPQYEKDLPTWLRHRDEGFEAAMREAGLEPLSAVRFGRAAATGLSTREEFDHRVRVTAGFLLEHFRGKTPPDALMTISDAEHYEAAAACEMLGLRPQHDVTIVGYDNYWKEADGARLHPELPPPAATVDKKNAQIGMSLANLLQSRIAGEFGDEPVHRTVEPELVLPMTDLE